MALHQVDRRQFELSFYRDWMEICRDWIMWYHESIFSFLVPYGVSKFAALARR